MHVAIPTEDMDALLWMRRAIPPGTLVHQPPEAPFIYGGRDAWVPIFAGRPIYAGPRGVVTSHALEDARAISQEHSAAALWAICRDRGIEVLYVSRTLEPDVAPAREALLASDARRFRKLFGNGRVSIWRVVGV